VAIYGDRIGIEKVWCKTPFNRNRKFIQNYYGLQHEFIIVSDPGQAGKKSGDFFFPKDQPGDF
jgi:hypothetical protein